MYGTGNGADKILDVCEHFSIPVEGVFASSDFVRSRSFRSMPVQSLSAIEERYGDDFVVLLAFGTTLSDVAENINRVAARHTLYIPEVPLYGKELFTYEYYLENLENIERAYSLLADERSKAVFQDMIAFRLTGMGKYLANVENIEESYKSIFEKGRYPRIIDFGAYKGDSTQMIVSTLEPEEIVAVEPDPKTFQKLSAYAENEKRCRVIPVNAAVGGECGEVEFSLSASRGSGKEGLSKSAKTGIVQKITVDSLCKESGADLLKFDVEGDESEALDGALQTIEKYSPSLALSVYHRTGDIFELCLRVHSLMPASKLYMRRVPCIPAWDITLFAKESE